ncbi:hypothetical protein [Natrinema longum]|uniref:Uncharacterized protein n=1 Tax=Natrinema longum TaxID=370324 RepID=A0A8A2U7Z1_9EURY|nr:hypothetical protein [Natrinema longum]MBZ6494168.1 hypothetical protein [Natrinema longum]QSW84502.1 hypothetical protein J0X27_13740 [Natrinema longum]
MKYKNKLFGRRNYLGKVATGVGSIAVLSNATSAKKNNIKREETENGVFISTTHSSGLVRPDIMDVREEVLPEKSNGAISKPSSVINKDKSSKKVAYYLGWVDNGPYERLWSAPPTTSAKEKEYKINGARKAVSESIENKSSSNSISSSSITTTDTVDGDDGISAGPDWNHIGTVVNDDYARVTVDGEEYTLGRVDITGRLYETDDISGDRQLGCVVSFLQWPGAYLDDHEESVSNGKGYNNKTYVEQDWSHDGRHNKKLLILHQIRIIRMEGLTAILT